MIYIKRNQLNHVALTLTETTTIPNPYFILSFQPLSTLDQLETIQYFTSPDISNYCNRYNEFKIVESDNGTPNANDSPIYLLPGQYEYKAYQSTSDSFDPDTFGIMLEVGKMVVGDLTVENPSTFLDPVYQ